MIETKLLRISEGDSRSLTFEQAYIQYGPLIKSKAYGWMNHDEFDEMFQISAIAFWEAYSVYDASFSQATFGSFAGKVIDNKLLAHYAKRKRRMKIVTFVSLDAPVSDDDGTELGELLGEDETYTTEVAEKIVIDCLMNRLPQKQRNDIQHILEGCRKQDVFALSSQSQSITAKRIKAALKRLKNMYLKEVEGF